MYNEITRISSRQKTKFYYFQNLSWPRYSYRPHAEDNLHNSLPKNVFSREKLVMEMYVLWFPGEAEDQGQVVRAVLRSKTTTCEAFRYPPSDIAFILFVLVLAYVTWTSSCFCFSSYGVGEWGGGQRKHQTHWYSCPSVCI